MKTYYGVVSRYYDNGKVVASFIGAVEAEEEPAGKYDSFSKFDRYLDWFDSEEKAKLFLTQAAEA